jgi:xylono-1,5-lactonase
MMSSAQSETSNNINCIWDAQATLGEGPLWVAREQAVYWVDIKQKLLHRLCIVTDHRISWAVPEQLTALAIRKEGGFVGTTRNGFCLIDVPHSSSRSASQPLHIRHIGSPREESAGNRFNDGKVDTQGRFWAGSMDDGEQNPTGALYRLDGNHQWQCCDRDYIITNGPTFSADGKTLYHTDTLARTIYAFDLDAQGALHNKRVFIQFDESSGFPDGMTVDAENCLWVCHFSGWGISRVSPEGEIISRIKLPVSNVTSCTFTGDNLDTLYITTARKGLTDAQLQEQPQAGGLFRYEPGVRGLPTNIYNG